MPPLLADATFWVAVVCFIVAQVAIVRAALIVRGGGDAPGALRPRRSREVMWAVVPGLALAVVLYFTWRSVHPPAPHQTAAARAIAGGHA